MGRVASISIAIEHAEDPQEAIAKAKTDRDYLLFANDIDGSPFAILVSQS